MRMVGGVGETSVKVRGKSVQALMERYTPTTQEHIARWLMENRPELFRGLEAEASVGGEEKARKKIRFALGIRI